MGSIHMVEHRKREASEASENPADFIMRRYESSPQLRAVSWTPGPISSIPATALVIAILTVVALLAMRPVRRRAAPQPDYHMAQNQCGGLPLLCRDDEAWVEDASSSDEGDAVF